MPVELPHVQVVRATDDRTVRQGGRSALSWRGPFAGGLIHPSLESTLPAVCRSVAEPLLVHTCLTGPPYAIYCMIPRREWTVRADDQVHEFLNDCSQLVEHAIRADIRKLRTRGLDLRAPLLGHFDGDVYYLRTQCDEGGYRVFYFRDGTRSFRAFFAYKKQSQAMPEHVKDTVRSRYRQITGERL